MKKKVPQKDYWVLNILDISSKQTREEGIRGFLKMEKLSVISREKLVKLGYEGWGLIRNFRGPTDPGLSRLLQTYHTLDIVELERLRGETILIKLKGKGKKYLNSLESFFSKLDPGFKSLKNNVNNKLNKNINKSGNELSKLREIQKLKEKPLRKKI